MKPTPITLSRWIRALGIATVILGLIHCAVTPVIFGAGFNRLSPADGRAFIFVFVTAGVAAIFAGLAIIYAASGLRLKATWAHTIVAGSGLFLALLGGGAVAAMPDNPFAYIALLISVLILGPLAASRPTEASRIREVALPAAPALITGAFPRIDYADAYCLPLPPRPNYTPEALARAVFNISLPWIDALGALRDVLVRPFGLKIAADMEKPAAQDDGLIFKVIEQSAREILMGEDDRHLDFRVSVLLDETAPQPQAIVSTVVRYNNWLGRAYFIPVRFFHRLIVLTVLKMADRRMQETTRQLAAQPNIP